LGSRDEGYFSQDDFEPFATELVRDGLVHDLDRPAGIGVGDHMLGRLRCPWIFSSLVGRRTQPVGREDRYRRGRSESVFDRRAPSLERERLDLVALEMVNVAADSIVRGE